MTGWIQLRVCFSGKLSNSGDWSNPRVDLQIRTGVVKVVTLGATPIKQKTGDANPKKQFGFDKNAVLESWQKCMPNFKAIKYGGPKGSGDKPVCLHYQFYGYCNGSKLSLGKDCRFAHDAPCMICGAPSSECRAGQCPSAKSFSSKQDWLDKLNRKFG